MGFRTRGNAHYQIIFNDILNKDEALAWMIDDEEVYNWLRLMLKERAPKSFETSEELDIFIADLNSRKNNGD